MRGGREPAHEGACYVNPTDSNFYAKPIEGLIATVDLGSMEVLEVIDTGALYISEDAWGCTEDEIDPATASG